MMVWRKMISIAIGIIILILTFLRENVFVEINAILKGYDYNKAYFNYFDASISKLTFDELLLLKWVLTITFIGVISGLTILIIKLWFEQNYFVKLSLRIYIISFVIVVFTTFLFKLLGIFNEYYFIVRKMIGILQSPLPLFILFSMYLYLRNNVNTLKK